MDVPFLTPCKESPTGAGAYNNKSPSPRARECGLNPVLVLEGDGDFSVYRRSHSRGFESTEVECR